MAWTLQNWNDVINAVNAALPTSTDDPDCPPIDPLPQDDGSKPWLPSDVQSVLDKLTELCPDNDFSDINLSKPWNPSWIDEIYAAISSGCCGPCCPSCCASDEVTITIFTCPNRGVSWHPDCDGNYSDGSGIGDTLGHRIDGLTVAKKNTENLNWQLILTYTTFRHPAARDQIVASGTVDSNGKAKVSPDDMVWPHALSQPPGPVWTDW